jgi:hypothetical protein
MVETHQVVLLQDGSFLENRDTFSTLKRVKTIIFVNVTENESRGVTRVADQAHFFHPRIAIFLIAKRDKN